MADHVATGRATTCEWPTQHKHSDSPTASQPLRSQNRRGDQRADPSYDIWDLGEFDQKGAVRTNWGTKEELLGAIKKAADLGIITYIDAVMNHK